MDKEIKLKLENVLKAEAENVLKNETNKYKKIDKMNTLFNLSKIINNYDELEPILAEYFNRKAEKWRWER